jgi:hypothetical protein
LRRREAITSDNDRDDAFDAWLVLVAASEGTSRAADTALLIE